MGLSVMDRKAFLAWLSEIDRLSEAQKSEVGEVLAGRPAGEASVAAVETCVGEDRTCPHCGTHGAVANGKSRGMQRYRCQSCNRTFGAVTGTSLSGLHHKDLWLTFAECLADGDTVAVAAKRCGIALSTAFRWRHRVLASIVTTSQKLTRPFFLKAVKVIAFGHGPWKGNPLKRNQSARPANAGERQQNAGCRVNKCPS